MTRVAVMTIFVSLFVLNGAYAHEGEMHNKEHMVDARMHKLHHIMPLYAKAQAKINEALANGDAATIKLETGKVLATIPDLTHAKPHKNTKQLSTFRKIASAFAEDVKKTEALAKSGDFRGAKDAFQFAQMRCNDCHVKFRD